MNKTLENISKHDKELCMQLAKLKENPESKVLKADDREYFIEWNGETFTETYPDKEIFNKRIDSSPKDVVNVFRYTSWYAWTRMTSFTLMNSAVKKTEHEKWIFEKFKGDMAIYAICPNCRFRHDVSHYDAKTGEHKIVGQYRFCPMCGLILHDGSKDISVKWNERSITELMEQEAKTHVHE